MATAPDPMENAKLLYGAGDGHAGGFEGMCPSGGGMDCWGGFDGLSGLAQTTYAPTDAQKEVAVYMQAGQGILDAFVQQKQARDAKRAAQIAAQKQQAAADPGDSGGFGGGSVQTYGMIAVAVLAVGAGLFFLTKKK
jgi:hypothetical protein